MKNGFNISLLIVTLIFGFIISCGGDMEQKKVTYNSLKDIPDAAWEKVSQKKIYFGHQSVGFNIMDGVEDLKKEYPQIKLQVFETKEINDLKPGVLAHSRVGKNTEPKSKIDEFENVLSQGIGQKADAAALKFCYVDILSDADVDKIFAEYTSEIEKLRKAYPDLTIFHFTAPLTQRQTGWKAFIKKLIGREIGGVEDNIKRGNYNELLIKEFQGKDPILDIAKIESTNPDGTRNSFEVDGKTYYSMVPEYTYDGGHLNEAGRKKVAEQLLLLLVNL